MSGSRPVDVDGPLSAVVLLPALSVTVSVSVRPLPSPVIVLVGRAAEATPEAASAQVQAMVTSPLYQPSALARRVGSPVSVGAVLSTLMPPTVVVAELPADVDGGAGHGLVGALAERLTGAVTGGDAGQAVGAGRR